MASGLFWGDRQGKVNVAEDGIDWSWGGEVLAEVSDEENRDLYFPTFGRSAETLRNAATEKTRQFPINIEPTRTLAKQERTDDAARPVLEITLP